MRVIFSVIVAHLILIIISLFFYFPNKSCLPQPKIAVRTIVLQDELAENPHQPRKSEKAQSKPQPKKPEYHKVKKKESKSKSYNTNRKKLLTSMQESLKTLDSIHSNIPIDPIQPIQIKSLVSEQLSFEAAFEAKLTAFLETQLKLPEPGLVKIKLLLSNGGIVQAVSFINTVSNRNRYYLEARLPTLIFPSFDSHFKKETEHSFLITLITHLTQEKR